MYKDQQKHQEVRCNRCHFAHCVCSDTSSYSRLGVLMILLINSSLLLYGCSTFAVAPSVQSGGGIGVPVTERTLAQRLLDESIEHTARVNIYALDESLKNHSRLSIHSFYSNVLLTGEVPDNSIKEEITKIVSSMPDVEKLYNYTNVSRVKGSSYTLHDGYITSKIVAKVITNRQIRHSQIKVVTDDGIVYVLGKLTPSEQGRLIEVMNNTVGIKELVLLTTLVDENGEVLTKDRIMQESGLLPPNFDDTQSSYPLLSTPAIHEPKTVDSHSNASANVSKEVKEMKVPSPYVELYKNQLSSR